MSTKDLNWMIIRDNHAFLKKVRDIKKPFSCESGNLRNLNSCRFNGLVQKKVIQVDPNPNGKGFVFGFKTSRRQNKPGKNMIRTTIKSTPRKSYATLKNFFAKNNYRKDLLKFALRKASAIHRSQKAIPLQSKRKQKKNLRTNRSSKSGKGSKKAE